MRFTCSKIAQSLSNGQNLKKVGGQQKKMSLKCLSPVYMVECSEIYELLFEQLLSTLVARRKLIPSVADSAKTECSDLITFVVKENRNEYLSFKKETDRLDVFF